MSLAGVPHHIIQRGNNRSVCFYADEDYRFYLQWLAEYLTEHECLLHAWVLMTNHVHLLITPKTCNGLGRLMKRLGQRYVQYVNGCVAGRWYGKMTASGLTFDIAN